MLASLDTMTPGVLADAVRIEIHIGLQGLKVGVIEATNVQLTKVNVGLAREIEQTCNQLRQQHSCDNLRQWTPIRAVREMFRDWGIDPSKYRPSSEALLRRIIKGEVLPRISNIVDVGNLGAIEMGWPYGCYDRAKISDPIEIRHGKPDEQYEGIGRKMLRLEGRPVFSDVHGPFGSPISDSTRTMVTESTNRLLVIICAPENCGSALEAATSKFGERLERWCGATGVQTRIVNPQSVRCSCFPA